MGTSESIERLRALAERQQGRVSRAQLRADAVSQPLITSWLSQGHLRSVLPGVYAVGHVAPSRDADLWAAVLYAGPGAALSHATAAERRRLIDQTAVAPIQVSTPRRVSSVTGVRVHARVAVERELYDGLARGQCETDPAGARREP